MTEIKKSPPYEYDVLIPRNISSARKYNLAVGTIGMAEESIITIDVEKPGTPTRLQSQNNRGMYQSLKFQQPPPCLPVDVNAVFADGAFLDVSESSKILFQISDPSIARVDKYGCVTGLSPGKTTLDIQYQGASLSVPINITP